MSSVELSELTSPDVSNDAFKEEISDNKDNEMDSSTSPGGPTSHEPPSWLFEKLRASKYCNFCQVILDYWSGILSDEPHEAFNDIKSNTYPHHKTLTGLHAAASQGCKICWLSYQNVKESPNKRRNASSISSSLDDATERESRGEEAFGFLEIRPLQYWVTKTASLDGEISMNEEYEGPILNLDQWHLGLKGPNVRYAELSAVPALFPVEKFSEESIVSTAELTADYVSSLRLAEKWLKTCMDSHPSCRHKLGNPPSRLLHIEGNTVRLSLQSKHYDCPPYATLSHCWGQLHILKLTSATIEEFQRVIPLDVLCKTFRDAILVARRLRFRYLWIDSLCIIQDDEQDWSKEAALMSSVYGSSDLNIAAAGAEDGNDGLFFNRISGDFRREQRFIGVVVKGKPKVFQVADCRIYSRCVNSQPLSSRAWALQERILAPRTLHFSQTEVFWECRRKCACDSFPNQLPPELCDENLVLKIANASEEDLQYTPPAWSSIVKAYTSASLTFGRDKLVAISGIAEFVQQHQSTRDEYLAGLWRNNLERALCWRVIRSRQLRPTPYRAPTWSWASTDGQVWIPENCSSGNHLYINVLEASVTSLTGSSFGEISDGVLKLRCEALLYGQKIESSSFELESGVMHARMLMDLKVSGHEKPSCFFLPIIRKSRTRLDTEEVEVKIEGILIQADQTQDKKGQYQRVGHLSTWYSTSHERKNKHDGVEIIEKEILSIEASGGLDDGSYAESVTDGNGKTSYVITIV